MPKTSLWCVYCDNSQIDSVARCNGLRVKKKNYLAYRWSVTSWIIHDENEYPGDIIYLFTYDKIKNLSNRFFLFFFLFFIWPSRKMFSNSLLKSHFRETGRLLDAVSRNDSLVTFNNIFCRSRIHQRQILLCRRVWTVNANKLPYSGLDTG